MVASTQNHNIDIHNDPLTISFNDDGALKTIEKVVQQKKIKSKYWWNTTAPKVPTLRSFLGPKSQAEMERWASFCFLLS